MAASARAIFLSRIFDRLQPPPSPTPLFSRHRISPFHRPPVSINWRSTSTASGRVIKCLLSGVDGGGVSDEFVSTRKSGFAREFSAIANMLKVIEPLDNSVISKGVSDSAKDSMKQTLSTMLGLLPSDQFAVTVRVSKQPLSHLLMSSIITGYTLWNAEYRLLLSRNFDVSTDTLESPNISKKQEVSEVHSEELQRDGCRLGADDTKTSSLQFRENLSPEALRYIHQLESELAIAKQELSSHKQESIKVECERKTNNDLLEYLRSLETDMVTELSRPSSLEVEEIIQQLVQNIMQKFFRDDATSNFMGDLSLENCKDGDDELSDSITTSRDYLAKLLFWCMLLGRHLRGLENRLHLNCVVGLL